MSLGPLYAVPPPHSFLRLQRPYHPFFIIFLMERLCPGAHVRVHTHPCLAETGSILLSSSQNCWLPPLISGLHPCSLLCLDLFWLGDWLLVAEFHLVVLLNTTFREHLFSPLYTNRSLRIPLESCFGLTRSREEAWKPIFVWLIPSPRF